LLAKRGLNSSPHPKKYGQGLPKPVRPQQENSPDQHPQPKREQQCADRRPRGSGPPPTPPQRERAVPLHPAYQILSDPPTTEKLHSLPAAHFPGVTIGYPVWHALGSGSERHEVGLGMPLEEKKGGTRPPPVVPGSRLRQVSFCRLLRHEPRGDRNAIVDRVEKILPQRPCRCDTLVRLD
jgi:hypothetical protein